MKKNNKKINDFDYSFYYSHKDEVIEHLRVFKETNPTPTVEGVQSSLDYINNEYGTSLEMLQYDYDLLNSEEENWQDFYLNNNYLSINDVVLIEEFSFDAENFDYNIALENFKINIIKLNPTAEEFARYNHIVNTIMITNDFFEADQIVLSGNKPRWWKAAGCATAIIANAGSTYALVVCAVPNPTTPAACGAAVVFKVVALAGVVFGCA